MIRKKQHAFERWSALMFGIAIIWLFTSVIAPIAESHIPGIHRLIAVTKIHTINPGAFWYTDIGVIDEARFFLANSTESSESSFSEHEP